MRISHINRFLPYAALVSVLIPSSNAGEWRFEELRSGVGDFREVASDLPLRFPLARPFPWSANRVSSFVPASARYAAASGEAMTGRALIDLTLSLHPILSACYLSHASCLPDLVTDPLSPRSQSLFEMLHSRSASRSDSRWTTGKRRVK